MSFAKTVSLEMKKDSIYRDGAIVLLGSILIGLCSLIAIPLPMTPVPIAFQNIVILMMALLLGSKRGSAAVFCFLVQGAMGLPVFALGKAGILTFLGPTGGYLIGYLVAAYVTGLIGEKLQRRTLPMALASLSAGLGIIYLLGTAYLSSFVGIQQAFTLGVLPFLAADVFKLVLSMKVLQWIGWNKSSCR
ncbi:MAG: biotin transporter BioY [Verrucomicrobia bacterium]|nr:biotin transporter BioY [Verrucomicrobiota bacterium]